MLSTASALLHLSMDVCIPCVSATGSSLCDATTLISSAENVSSVVMCDRGLGDEFQAHISARSGDDVLQRIDGALFLPHGGGSR